ncbi:unnamed protein product [Peniophora sp. CBMAI 1063]|nr:unnamed protein product [Peniophora sp. CBMAI 1063]
MDRCPDEVLQLILNDLSDPSAFVKVNKRLYALSRVPYTRASYLLARHGLAEVLFHALGRADILTGRVLEILMSSGALVSRYLVQLAVRHYHHSQVSFVHQPWVRALPFAVFVQFLSLATSKLGTEFTIPRRRELDDGEVFHCWASQRWNKAGTDAEKEKRLEVVHILGDWKLQPLCAKDPIASDFSLILACEPALLLLAMKNGYLVDSTYRDFIFRQMFLGLKGSKPAVKEMSVRILLELCRFQNASFFLSRTVAAEVLMDCVSNAEAYIVLCALGREGRLKFDLLTLAVDLIKTFATTRSVTDPGLAASVLRIFSDLPDTLVNDPEVRHVLFVVVFSSTASATAARARFIELGCTGLETNTPVSTGAARMEPIRPEELVEVLASPFISSRLCSIGAYAYLYARFEPQTISAMLQQAAVKCLGLSCKGEMLEMLARSAPSWRKFIADELLKQPRVDLDAIPSGEAAAKFVAPLARSDYGSPSTDKDDRSELGTITQMTLSASAALDLVIPPDMRYRFGIPRKGATFKRLPCSNEYRDSQSTQPQNVPLRLDEWVAEAYGPRSMEAAVIAEHAVANWVDPYVERQDAKEEKCYWWDQEKRERVEERTRQALGKDVPMTMKHWRILARLGKEPDYDFFSRISHGVPFYEDAEDYVGQTTNSPTLDSSTAPAAGVCETLAEDEDRKAQEQALRVAERIRNHGLWVKALGALCREELRAHSERRKQLGLKRAAKSKFLVTLENCLSDYRQSERDKKARKRQQLLKENPTAYIDLYGDIVPKDHARDERPAKRRRKE